MSASPSAQADATGDAIAGLNAKYRHVSIQTMAFVDGWNVAAWNDVSTDETGALMADYREAYGATIMEAIGALGGKSDEDVG